MAWLVVLWAATRVALEMIPWSPWTNLLVSMVISLGPAVFIGMKANGWYRKHLEKQGFRFQTSGDESTVEKFIIDQYAEAEE
ncbi:MAG: hypothetical protein IFK94_00865 [Acidobacteria bacterium]|uniref:DUF2628 domain-containing protein n=1 Tax=Candidatus Polarisedimenticola svalbardensis TaxID=2886004 RepID=A0A8J6XQI4_9BACT|nr:hypothetical protein [Candidatus Polarisedimenticola svalbardensis]